MKPETWENFRDSGMLWWANRALQIFGWVIVANIDETGKIVKIEPCRTKYRGFSPELDEQGFRRVTTWIRDNGSQLMAEVETEDSEIR